jgi:hypothetical protein
VSARTKLSIALTTLKSSDSRVTSFVWDWRTAEREYVVICERMAKKVRMMNGSLRGKFSSTPLLFIAPRAWIACRKVKMAKMIKNENDAASTESRLRETWMVPPPPLPWTDPPLRAEILGAWKITRRARESAREKNIERTTVDNRKL